ncbi:MAG TPA: hypothetical protein VNW92_18400 [Polyangiaceae bacterium]|nr:hypothetical protein [Polyangiaceae bacterium]
MTNRPKAHEVLRGMLASTREDELDCDRFLELLAPWLDERIENAALRELLEHHRRQCPECAEEVSILERALDLTEK